MRPPSAQAEAKYAAFKTHYSSDTVEVVEKAVESVRHLIIKPDPCSPPSKTLVTSEIALQTCKVKLEMFVKHIEYEIRRANYGAILEATRRSRGLSREAVEKALNLARNDIQDIECGDRVKTINESYLKMFCLFYDVRPDHLLGEFIPYYPMIYHHKRKAACIQHIIWNLSSDDGNKIGDKLLSAILTLSKIKNSSIRKEKKETPAKDTISQINDIFRNIPAIPSPASLELPDDHRTIPIRNWETFFVQLDALSILYDKNPEFVEFLYGISTCDDSIKEIVFLILDKGGFEEYNKIQAK